MRIIRIPLLIIIVCMLTGCSNMSTIYSNFKEAGDTELVHTVGIDTVDGQIEITVESGISGTGQQPKVYSAKAETLDKAINNMQRLPIGKEMYFAHTQHIVIGENAAKDELFGIIDYIARATEFRFDVSMFVVNGGTAKDLITKCLGKDSSANMGLRYIQRDIPYLTSGYVFDCHEISVRLAETGSALIMGVKLEDNMEEGEGVAEKTIMPAGFAIIGHDGMLKFLDEKSTAGASILMNKAKYESLDIPLAEGTVSIGVERAAVKLAQNKEADEIDVTINIRADVIQVSGGMDITRGSVKKEMEKKIREIEYKRVSAAVNELQLCGIDYMDISRKLELKAPVRLSDVNGNKEIYNSVYNININIEISGTYDLTSPITVNGRN